MTFDESAHPRNNRSKRFVDKVNSAPQPLPEPRQYVAGTIGGWSVRDYKLADPTDGNSSYTATIYRDDVPVLGVSYDGQGSPERFSDPRSGFRATGYQVLEDFEQTAIQVTGGDPAVPGSRENSCARFVGLAMEVAHLQRQADKYGISYEEVAALSHERFAGLSSHEADVVRNPAKYS